MTNQEAMIKMAELCNYKTDIIGDELMIIIGKSKYGKEFLRKWNPRENIDQAMEVLEALNIKDIRLYVPYAEKEFWTCELFSRHICGHGQNKSEAIFQAVKKYLEDKGND